MGYKLKQFKQGLQVYHITNNSVTMVVVSINEETEMVKCSWMEDGGKLHEKEFPYGHLTIPSISASYDEYNPHG